MSDKEIEYTPEFIAQLEGTWGDGFLSPGGPDAVASIVRGIDLQGAQVLDIGVGLGGPAIVLANAHGAAHVTGIDVEAPVLEGARTRVADAGLEERISLQLVEPGPLAFEDERFDVVFSKDSIVHVPDKAALFAECKRVLRPGGWLAMSDWFRSSAPYTPAMTRYTEQGPLKFAMRHIEASARELMDAGFDDVSTRDRNAWFVEQTARELTWLQEGGQALIAEVVGEATAEDWLSRCELRATVAAEGQLRPGHLRGRKPV